jgi:hypothetical protein
MTSPPTRRTPNPFARSAIRVLSAGALLVGIASVPLAPHAAAATSKSGGAAKPAPFPSIVVTDIKTSKPYNLTALAKLSGTRATLVWFWAPH